MDFGCSLYFLLVFFPDAKPEHFVRVNRIGVLHLNGNLQTVLVGQNRACTFGFLVRKDNITWVADFFIFNMFILLFFEFFNFQFLFVFLFFWHTSLWLGGPILRKCGMGVFPFADDPLIPEYAKINGGKLMLVLKEGKL